MAKFWRCCLTAVIWVALVSSLRADSSRHETIRDVLPRMVKIFGAGGLRNLEAYSTGFLVSAEGHVVTVWSHVLDTDELRVVLDDGRRYEAKVLGAEPRLDLAVLKLQAEDLDLPHFDLQQQTTTAEAGRSILAFSNMYKVAVGDEPVSVQQGVVAAHTRLPTRRGIFENPYQGPVYIVDAITNNPGAGGGALTTSDGRLLGMIGKQLRNAESNTWVNYAMPIGQLREPIRAIISGETLSDRPRQRTAENPERYRPLDFGLVLLPDVVRRTPAYIDEVMAESPAAEAGLRPGDLVVFVNDKLVQSRRMLEDVLGRLEAGTTLHLVIRRNDQLISVDIPVRRKEDR